MPENPGNVLDAITDDTYVPCQLDDDVQSSGSASPGSSGLPSLPSPS